MLACSQQHRGLFQKPTWLPFQPDLSTALSNKQSSHPPFSGIILNSSFSGNLQGNTCLANNVCRVSLRLQKLMKLSIIRWQAIYLWRYTLWAGRLSRLGKTRYSTKSPTVCTVYIAGGVPSHQHGPTGAMCYQTTASRRLNWYGTIMCPC